MSYWIALLLVVASNVGANAVLKHFVQTTEFSLSWHALFGAALKPSLWIGLSLSGILLASYLYAIKGLPLSTAYVFATTLSIVGITCAGVFLYGEAMAPRAMLGVAVVILGVSLIATA